jgi:cytochrome P450
MSETIRAGLPPGPRQPVALQTWKYWGRRDEMLRRCRARYGPTFTIRAAPAGVHVYVTDPDDVKRVFTGDPAVFRAGEANAVLRPVMGENSVLVSDQPAHLAHRRRMLPAFNGAVVERYEAVVRAVTEADTAKWPTGEPFALHPRMQAVTLDVILRAVIGIDEGPAAAPLRTVLRDLVEISPLLMLMWLRPELRHVGPWRRYARVKADADALLFAEIRRRREDPSLADRADVLSQLMRGADGESGMGDEELRDQLVTLLLAGHETTATALSWAVERLVRCPEQMSRLLASLDRGEDDYLAAVVTETLRVRPVIFDVSRVLHAPVRLGGYDLPAGVTVVPSIGLIHANEDVYDKPGDFRPERFLDERPGTYEWLPFGGGIRRCLGAPFALLEMRAVLRSILERFELEPADLAPERPKMRHITFVPERGCRVVARDRNAWLTSSAPGRRAAALSRAAAEPRCPLTGATAKQPGRG